MLQEAIASESSRETSVTLIDRIHDAIDGLAPAVAGGPDVWARGAGPHVLLGLEGDDAFARLTPLGGGLFGLSFRALEAGPSEAGTAGEAGEAEGAPSGATFSTGAGNSGAWEPLLLIDELAAVVEHALVAVEAIVIQ